MLGFLIITLGLGGAAAVMSGRALALTWRSRWSIALYMLLLAMAVRFLNYALLGKALLSERAYAIDFIVLVSLALLSFSRTRHRQMKRQYYWLTHAS
jgi:hypothetical protein